jgi:hypothetical protein
VLPSAGADGLLVAGKAEGRITLSVEVFKLNLSDVSAKAASNVIVVQQRSRCRRGHEVSYTEAVMSWAKECGFSEVIVLGGSDAKDRLDFQMGSNAGAVEYITNSETSEQRLASLGLSKVVSMAEREFLISRERGGGEVGDAADTLRSGGLTRGYFAAAKSVHIGITALVSIVIVIAIAIVS